MRAFFVFSLIFLACGSNALAEQQGTQPLSEKMAITNRPPQQAGKNKINTQPKTLQDYREHPVE